MLGAFTLLAFLGALGGSMHDGYSKSEVFVIFASLAVALYYLCEVWVGAKSARDEIAPQPSRSNESGDDGAMRC